MADEEFFRGVLERNNGTKWVSASYSSPGQAKAAITRYMRFMKRDGEYGEKRRYVERSILSPWNEYHG